MRMQTKNNGKLVSYLDRTFWNPKAVLKKMVFQDVAKSSSETG
jgi:hypothetical protein